MTGALPGYKKEKDRVVIKDNRISLCAASGSSMGCFNVARDQ